MSANVGLGLGYSETTTGLLNNYVFMDVGVDVGLKWRSTKGLNRTGMKVFFISLSVK